MVMQKRLFYLYLLSIGNVLMHFPMHLPHMYLLLHGCMHTFLLENTKKRCTIKIIGSTLNLE